MTTSKVETLRRVLNQADPNELADAFRLIRLGDMLSTIKVAFAGLTSAAAQDITTAAAKTAAGANITGITLETGENLPPIGDVTTLRVVTGGTAGARSVTDAGGTASTTVALLSDDGKTLTFEAAVTAFTLTYRPRAPLTVGNMDTLKWAPSV